MGCLKSFLVFLHTLVDKLIDVAFSLVWERERGRVPDLEPRHSFLAESTVTLARRIKEGSLKSEDLMKAVIDRIEEVNPVVNAVAEQRFEAALAEARDVDRRVAAGLSPEDLARPFLGIPFTAKESHPIKGMRNTWGLASRRDVRAAADSAAVRHLRAAGAVPLATTNLPELLYWPETRNPVYGQTCNPHHAGRTAGGSSGAEAALVACCATPISLCSDVGGSTRMPAFYCGMFGHHPTVGATDCQGIFDRSGAEASMFALGTISRRAGDLTPLVAAIAGERAPRLRLDRRVDLKKVKFYYVESSGDCLVSSVRPELRDTMTKVVTKISEDLSTSKNAPEPYYHAALDHMYALWRHWMAKEPEDFARLFTNNSGEAKWYSELFKKIFCMSNHAMSSIVNLMEKQVIPMPDPEWADKLTQEFKDDLFSKLGDNGVLLFPSAPHPAPYHYTAFLRPYNFAYWAVINVLQCPATQIPMGVSPAGLPLGLQAVAAPHQDALTLAVAEYLEKEFQGAAFPCKIGL